MLLSTLGARPGALVDRQAVLTDRESREQGSTESELTDFEREVQRLSGPPSRCGL